MIPLRAKVKIKFNDVDGEVVIRNDFLAGYSLYAVRFLKPDTQEIMSVNVHDFDIEVLSEENAIISPVADERFALGTHVYVLPEGDFSGVVTAQEFSSSGCVQYEVTGFVEGKGTVRHVLEGEILVPIPEAEPIPEGKSTGSYTRKVSVR